MNNQHLSENVYIVLKLLQQNLNYDTVILNWINLYKLIIKTVHVCTQIVRRITSMINFVQMFNIKIMFTVYI